MLADEFFAAVIDFNHDILHIEARPLAPMTTGEVTHLRKAIAEESQELQDAHDDQDLVKSVDALVDNMYFAVGGLYKMGLTAEQISKCCMAVHNANMEKKKGVVASRATEGAVDAIKPEGWKPPEERIGQILFGT